MTRDPSVTDRDPSVTTRPLVNVIHIGRDLRPLDPVRSIKAKLGLLVGASVVASTVVHLVRAGRARAGRPGTP